ncbi:hypothetical protein IAR55_002912 [Kwoniella newhampshirensis]|uniref:N-alpha-acetyltransferase 40 n=1 Tax=Kwoniella newhampshirensis TaxID=1651941 RepID=A0AAW0Z018_9TREE
MATAKIRSANAASTSILAPDLPRHGHLPDGRPYKLSLVCAEQLSDRSRDAIFGLFDSNMCHLQSTSSFPYTESSKREELFEQSTRYLLLLPASPDDTKSQAGEDEQAGTSAGARTTSSGSTSTSTSGSLSSNGVLDMPGESPPPSESGAIRFKANIASMIAGESKSRSKRKSKSRKRKGKSIVEAIETVDIGPEDLFGFSSFRFDTEETLTPRDAEVIYCYELQLAPSVRGQGSGKLLITHLEQIGRGRELDKVMLTCLKSNTTALAFYTKHGYVPDEIDPTRMAEEEEWSDDDEASQGVDGGDEARQVDYVILSKSLKGKDKT